MTATPGGQTLRRLRGESEDGELSRILAAGVIVLGSSEECDVVIPLPGVSRRHARLTDRPEGLEVEDLASRNGTFLEGKPVSAPTLARPGQRLRFGPVELMLEEIPAGDGVLALVVAETGPTPEVMEPASTETVLGPPRGGGTNPGLVLPEGYVAGDSQPVRDLHLQVAQLARGDLPVLILGDTGSGKELVARLVHESSLRRRGPFIAINSAAIPAELLEAELFGIGEGVATGVRARKGRFQLASGGTLFLDEIGDMPLPLQAKLLRALETGEVQPVGRSAVAVDVRFLAATHTDLDERVAAGLFRRDLYYRIAGAVLRVPSLAERPEDLPLLLTHFLRRAARATGKTIRGVSARALEALSAYPWPGNVRELEHEVQRLVHLAHAGGIIDSGLLDERFLTPQAEGSGDSGLGGGSLRLKDHVAATERRVISEALKRSGGSQRRAARLLGVARNTLARKIEELGLDVDRLLD